METLIAFLKHSSVPDLLVIILVLLSAVILIAVGIWIVIASRRRKPIYVFLMIALLPLLLGLLGTYLKSIESERAIARAERVSASLIAEVRQENWIMTDIGLVGTAVPVLIGVMGLAFRKERDPDLSLTGT